MQEYKWRSIRKRLRAIYSWPTNSVNKNFISLLMNPNNYIERNWPCTTKLTTWIFMWTQVRFVDPWRLNVSSSQSIRLQIGLVRWRVLPIIVWDPGPKSILFVSKAIRIINGLLIQTEFGEISLFNSQSVNPMQPWKFYTGHGLSREYIFYLVSLEKSTNEVETISWKMIQVIGRNEAGERSAITEVDEWMKFQLVSGLCWQ